MRRLAWLALMVLAVAVLFSGGAADARCSNAGPTKASQPPIGPAPADPKQCSSTGYSGSPWVTDPTGHAEVWCTDAPGGAKCSPGNGYGWGQASESSTKTYVALEGWNFCQYRLYVTANGTPAVEVVFGEFGNGVWVAGQTQNGPGAPIPC